jgi:alpha-tubulin suppressor-like RCC1 family protein
MGASHAFAFLLPFAGGCVIITGDQERQHEIEVEDTGDQLGDKWVQLAAGGLHTCGLRENGIVECWGKNDKGQANPPSDARFSQITAGDSHSCGLQKDPNAGVPRCWGDNTWGNVGDVPQVAFEKLSAGAFFTCGLQLDHTALCWGQNDDGQTNVVPGEQYKDISAGAHHTCAIRVDGTIYCWGQNDCDQATYPGGNNWEHIASGTQFSCAIDDVGEITCWGAKQTNGCDYNAGTTDSPETDRKDPTDPWWFVDIEAGPWHACALTSNEEIMCWGQNSQGATDMDDDFLYENVSAGGGYGGDHTCALTTPGNDILCEGFDTWGQCSPPVDPDDVTDTGTKKK